jgi:hypothetical protein
MPLKRALTTIGTSVSRKVTIFVSKAVNYKVIDKFTDENGRIVLLNVHIDDAVFPLDASSPTNQNYTFITIGLNANISIRVV